MSEAIVAIRMPRYSNIHNRPFLLDLESTNGTQVNDKEIPVSRYYEIMTGDVIKFGLDKREFVLIRGGATKE